jgi:adenylate kinase family enzyme
LKELKADGCNYFQPFINISHAASGRSYNLNFNPPKINGKDDITGEPLSKRDDDNVDVFRTRLENYKIETMPLIDFYNEKKILRSYHGKTSDEITPLIHSDLESFFLIKL